MENINTDKLYNFVSHALILFLLFIIIYFMYIDFIREKITKKVYPPSFQEKFNNLISSNEENIIFDKNDSTGLTLQNRKRNQSDTDIIEEFIPIDPELKYIIKRNYNNINNATCIAGDYNNTTLNKCYMTISNFYPTQSYINSSIYISPLPDSILDSSIGKRTFYASIKNEKGETMRYNNYYEPDLSGSDTNLKMVNMGYKSNYFNFSNDKKGNRKFDYTNPLEDKIIKYFANCMNYYKLVTKSVSSDTDLISGLLITDNTEFNKLSNDLQEKIINAKKRLINDFQDMLLLKSSFNNSFTLPANIYEIKENLIKYYEPHFNQSKADEQKEPGKNLSITDNSKLILLIDPKTQSDILNNSPNNNTIYSIIFKININIKLTNLAANFTDNTLDPKLLSSLDKFNGLNYVPNTTNIYTYENEILFPIGLPFNTPNITKTLNQNSVVSTASTASTVSTKGLMSTLGSTNSTTTSADVSDTKWYTDIQAYMSTIFIENQLQKRNKIPIKSGVDAVSTIMSSIDPIKNDINNLSNILDIFAVYLPDNGKFDSKTGKFYFVITTSSSNSLDPNIIIVLLFDNTYDPNFCMDSKSDLYNKKCLPKCPDNYGIDLGLICVKSDISNFTPNSDFCVQLNALSPVGSKNSILQGLLDACNPDNINNISNEALFNIKDIKGVTQVNDNKYMLNHALNDSSILSTDSTINDSSTDSIFTSSFNNVKQHFGNVDNVYRDKQFISTRKESKRYAIESRETTTPLINRVTGNKIEHFSPFLN
jgi:hypothetical protein